MKIRPMTIEEVAKEINKPKQFVRVQMQRCLVSWGTALKMPRK